jgi:hypothetical protein
MHTMSNTVINRFTSETQDRKLWTWLAKGPFKAVMNWAGSDIVRLLAIAGARHYQPQWVAHVIDAQQRAAAPIHTLDVVPPSDAPDLRAMTHDDAIEVMVGWFFANFEDPVHSLPRDGGEYVFIWGGPYAADVEIQNAFEGKACGTAITEAIAQIENEGLGWTPSAQRIRPGSERG